jgi:hypothetical protein
VLLLAALAAPFVILLLLLTMESVERTLVGPHPRPAQAQEAEPDMLDLTRGASWDPGRAAASDVSGFMLGSMGAAEAAATG